MILITLILLLLGSMISALVFGRFRAGLYLLLAASGILGWYFITMDPFLHAWDERFHALVASNLVRHPLKPTLVDRPYLPYDYTNWGFNHIWLHKQPFFLWLMALSIKLFGHAAWAVRLPSALCIPAMILMVYDSCCRLMPGEGKRWGYWAALLLSSNVAVWNIASGFMCMDANDMVFMAMVTGSFWAWIRMERSGKYGWPLLAGCFIAAAILTKWLTGVLVLEAWLLYHVLVRRDLFRKATLTRLVLILGVAGVLAGSWIAYCALHYPAELKHELAYNSRHFSEVLELHQQAPSYYFSLVPTHYPWVWLLWLPALVLAWVKRKAIPELYICTICVLSVYIFFTLAATKMEGYVLMCLPLVCLLLAYPLSFLRFSGKPAQWTVVLAAAGLWYLHFDLPATKRKHFPENGLLEYGTLRADELSLQSRYRKLDQTALDSVDCIIYAKEAINAMYYTGKTAHGWIAPEQIDSLNRCGVRLGFIEGDATERDYGLDKMRKLTAAQD